MQVTARADVQAAHFDTEHLCSDFAARAFNGGALTLLSQIVKLLLRSLSLVVLARLLTPEDYGLFAIVTIVTTFSTVIGDLGSSAATVQTGEIDHEQATAMFWLILALSLALSIITAAVAQPAGQFYREPRLVPLVMAMAMGSILLALGYQHQAILKRQMRFKQLAIIEALAMLIGVVIAIASACGGVGVWALVYMQLSSALAATAGAWLVCSWRPGCPTIKANIRSLLGVSKDITSLNVLSYAVRNLDNLLIGRFCGASPLGLYDKAYQLYMMPMQVFCWPFASVILASLSRLRYDEHRFNQYARSTFLLLTGLCVPIVMFASFKASAIVSITLGERWLNLVPTFWALTPAALAEPLWAGLGYVFISYGSTGRLLKIWFAQSVVTVIGFMIGVHWGTIGVAASFSIIRVTWLLPVLLLCCAGTSVKWRELALAPLYPFAASAAAMAVVYLTERALGNLIPQPVQFLQLSWESALFALVYLSIWVCSPRARITVRQIFQSIR